VADTKMIARDRLLNMKQAQEHLNVGRSTTFALVLSGELRSVKIGNRRLVPESALIDFIEQLNASTAQRQDFAHQGNGDRSPCNERRSTATGIGRLHEA
jgi:excisionase family DNA binding protein